MSSVDPDRPGRRLSGVDPRSAEGQALADAFNAMLDRLESARREAARTALAAQEAERLRVARELHDEIGQTLTAVTIQAERAADGDPALASAGAAAGRGRRPRQPGRGAPHRPRAASRGARRPRAGQRADRALLADRRSGRPARSARASGEAAAAVAGRRARHLPGRPGEPHQRPAPLRRPHGDRVAQGRRGDAHASRRRRRQGDAGRSCPAARPGSRACASGRCWSAAGSRSSRGQATGPRCG